MSATYATNSKARPLLRGALIHIGPWFDTPGRPGFQKREAQLAVWCPCCAAFHYHGWDPARDGRYAEHRVSHCFGETLFKRGGYYIGVFRKGEPGCEAHVTPPGRAIVREKPVGRVHKPATDSASGDA